MITSSRTDQSMLRFSVFVLKCGGHLPVLCPGFILLVYLTVRAEWIRVSHNINLAYLPSFFAPISFLMFIVVTIKQKRLCYLLVVCYPP